MGTAVVREAVADESLVFAMDIDPLTFELPRVRVTVLDLTELNA